MTLESHRPDTAAGTDAPLTHLDAAGHAHMVDVGAKPATRRRGDCRRQRRHAARDARAHRRRRA